MTKSERVSSAAFQAAVTSSSDSRLFHSWTRLRNRRPDSHTRDDRRRRRRQRSASRLRRHRRCRRRHRTRPWKRAPWASATATWRRSPADWTWCCWSYWSQDCRQAGQTWRTRSHGNGSAFGTDNPRAAVADNDGESRGRGAYTGRLGRLRVHIDLSVCVPRAARTCPRTWTITESGETVEAAVEQRIAQMDRGTSAARAELSIEDECLRRGFTPKRECW